VVTDELDDAWGCEKIQKENRKCLQVDK